MAEYIEVTCKNCLHYDVCYHIEHYGREIETDKPCEKFKSADVVEVVHGRWETRMLGDDVGYNCSACHLTSDWDTPYCPQCGALMDGKEV